MVCSCKSTMSVRIRSPPALNSWVPLSPQIRCVFLRKGHRSQAAPWSLEQVWVGSRKSRNFPSIQNAPRRLNDSCRSATLCGLRRFRSFRRSKSPFVRLGEQVSVQPHMLLFQGNNQTSHLSVEIKGASRLNNTPTQEGLLHSRLAEPLARVLLTIGLACSKYESNMFGTEIE